MRSQYRQIRTKQLSRSLDSFKQTRAVTRPPRGWLKAVRDALGIPAEQVGRLIHTTKQGVQYFEKAEAEDRITLKNLRRVAEAMGCELVYAIVPKSGSIENLADQRARIKATKRVLSVEHSMALEDQTPGGVNELIDEETKRIIKKS